MNFIYPEDLHFLMTIDVILFLVCSALLYGYGGLSFSHPATSFLFYHFYCNSFRLFSIIIGAETMYELEARLGYGREPVSYQEIARAMIWMDIGLVLFTASSLVAKSTFHNRTSPNSNGSQYQYRAIDRNFVRWAMITMFLIGMPFFLAARGQMELDLGVLTESGYGTLFAMWPVSTLLIAIYFWGFRWYLLLPVGLFLSVFALQGYHRFMLVLPLILLTNIYVFRSSRRWPSTPFLILGLVLFAIFPYLKEVGRAYQRGETEAVVDLLKVGSRQAVSMDPSTSPDFLDQFGCALTLADRHGKVYWGSNYLALLTYPVPRILWPEKPSIVQQVEDISTPQRPIKGEGRIVTWMGDAYLNFREPGMVIFPILLGFFLTRWALIAQHFPQGALWTFLYVMTMPSLIQLWRDGIISMLFFTLIHYMPILVVLVFHLIPGFVPKQLLDEELNQQSYL